jgi:endoglucanase
MKSRKSGFFLRFVQRAGFILFIPALLAACGGGPALGDIDRVLEASWQAYAGRFISPEGRVVLSERGGESISEAQAYALLRALWAGDEASFARVYAWTREHLSRADTQGDHLLAWHWGRREDGSWGVLDWNTAADADLDYAMALWLAARRGWRAPAPWPAYAAEARAVARDILDKEMVRLPDGDLMLTPGNWHELEPAYLLNPSYFSPAAYHLFGEAGLDPRWPALHRDAYPVLARLTRKVGDMAGVGLFPDWVRVEASGAMVPAPGRDTNFGWEAVRLPWRLALDRLWFGDEEAARLLGRDFLPFFQKEWQKKGKLAAVYSYEGQPLVRYESPVLYAGVLAAALAAGEAEFARQMAEKILSFYRENGDAAYFVEPDNYYTNNWAWFGLALYAGWVRVF